MTGTIKTLTEKGFGFIGMGQGKRDLFFHSKDLQGVRYEELQVGDTLEFDIADGEKGPYATRIIRVEAE